MEFPEYSRVIFKNDPLAQVVCQLRFSRILELENALPVDFQKSIIEDYPILDSRNLISLDFDELTKEKSEKAAVQKSGAFDFFDKDRTRKLTLTSTYLALATDSYGRWEDFQNQLWQAVGIASEIYGIRHFTRVGLRYQNIIDREALQLSSEPWKELITPELAGIFVNEDCKEADIIDTTSSIAIKMDCGNAIIRHGLLYNQEDEGKTAYLIDNDIFKGELPNDETCISTLEKFHESAGRIFSWCIQPKLRSALGPE